MRNRILLTAAIALMMLTASGLRAQSNGTAGTQSLFVLGAGARALGLGNAYVAMPQDPTAIYWNPAGMEFLQRKSATFFYTNLPLGTTYNFVGFVYPTLNFGTIGFGAIHIGTGDIPLTNINNQPLGTDSFGQTEFFLSYAKELPIEWLHLTVGASFKLEVQNFFPGFSSTGLNFDAGEAMKQSDNGVGLDLGFMYRPEWSGLLENLSIGLNLQNIYRPELRVGDSSESMPTIVRFGIAKPVRLRDGQDAFTIYADLTKSANVSPGFHVGTEYVYRDNVSLRLGYNQGQPTFGAGYEFFPFRLDYSFGNFAANPFGQSHRISLTIELGKSRTEMRALADSIRMQEIAAQALLRQKLVVKEQFEDSMAEGRRAYEEGKYIDAFASFSSAIDFAQQLTTLDYDQGIVALEDAREWFQRAEDELEKEKEESIRQAIEEAREREAQAQLKAFVDQQFEKGMKFFQKGQYQKAIDQWQLVLDRVGSNPLIEEWIGAARKKMAGQVRQMINRADRLAAQGNYLEAIGLLNEARGLNITDQERQEIARKIRRYQTRLTFEELYQQGLIYYNNKNWQGAMQTFEEALKVEPKNPTVQRYYEEAKARALAKQQEMPAQVRLRFQQGFRLYQRGQYQEAIQVWEELLKIQPYNKTILDAIDRARENLKEQK
jgi:tetratricopeptide (TPR) repeat protein